MRGGYRVSKVYTYVNDKKIKAIKHSFSSEILAT